MKSDSMSPGPTNADAAGPDAVQRGSALLGLYRQPDFILEQGDGSRVRDTEGRSYLDFTSGIAVTALGHASPVVAEAIRAALDRGLIHTSNLYRTEPAEALAALLTTQSSLDRAFFCNSGAEAVEGALKFARRRAREVGGAEKHRIVALRGGFHGRLFGSLAVTDRPEYRAPFEPLMPGVDFVDPEDFEALDRALDSARTAALIAEPIQGEGGVRPLSDPYLRSMRELTAERDISLILDEIQCGLGRTGELFAHQSAGIRPDLLVLAKPLAGGLPMGAVLLDESVASALRPGDHGTTFGGGPLVASAALAVLETMAQPAFLSGVRERGELLARLLDGLVERHPSLVRGHRGRGLIRGLELHGPAAEVVERARAAGLLLVGAGAEVVRLIPPLTVAREELHEGIEILEAALAPD
jgi:predicted acetylornithine/succinylornithine family transaminase